MHQTPHNQVSYSFGMLFSRCLTSNKGGAEILTPRADISSCRGNKGQTAYPSIYRCAGGMGFGRPFRGISQGQNQSHLIERTCSAGTGKDQHTSVTVTNSILVGRLMGKHLGRGNRSRERIVERYGTFNVCLSLRCVLVFTWGVFNCASQVLPEHQVPAKQRHVRKGRHHFP